MAITIITQGSSSIGIGHIRRSATLATHMQQYASVQIWILSHTENADPGISCYFEGLNVGCGPQPNHQSTVEIFDLEPPAMQRCLLRPAEKTKRLCLDLCDPRILPDVTMNIIDHSQQMRSAYVAAGRGSDYFEGPDYAIIRRSLSVFRPPTVPTVSRVSRVLITLGGADPSRRTLEAVAVLKKCISSDILFTVIVGPLVPADYEAKIRAAVIPPNTVVRAPDNYEQILAEADVVLCSGGGTLLEAMCLGKPVVVFPQTIAEESHSQSHANSHACVLSPSLRFVLESEELRSELAANAYRRIDGQGSKRIVEASLRLLHMD